MYTAGPEGAVPSFSPAGGMRCLFAWKPRFRLHACCASVPSSG